MREQVESLEYHTHLQKQRFMLLRSHGLHDLSVLCMAEQFFFYKYLAACYSLESVKGSQESRLAGAGGSDYDHHFSLLNGKVHIL